MNEKIKPSKIPYFFVCFFTIFIIVDIAYIIVANSTWRGVISEDAYDKGIDHNQILHLQNLQKKIGWKFAIKLENLGNKKAILKVKIIDKEQKNLTSLQVEVKLSRPIQAGLDFTKKLAIDEEGWYQAKIELPNRGQWQFEVIASDNKNLMQEVKKFVIQ